MSLCHSGSLQSRNGDFVVFLGIVAKPQTHTVALEYLFLSFGLLQLAQLTRIFFQVATILLLLLTTPVYQSRDPEEEKLKVLADEAKVKLSVILLKIKDCAAQYAKKKQQRDSALRLRDKQFAGKLRELGFVKNRRDKAREWAYKVFFCRYIG